jgi:hypothetical protein
MKVGTDGRWTGLVYCEKASPYVDYFSSPDGWRFGFDVVDRLIFNTEDRDIIDMFRAAFMAAFGLSKEHYSIPDIGPRIFAKWMNSLLESIVPPPALLR